MRLNVTTTLLLTLFLTAFTTLQAQAPDNDDCSGLIDLGEAPYCPDVTIPGNETEIYSNVDATESDIGFGNNPTCFNGGTPQRDVWFSFIASDTIFDYTITVMGVEGPDGEPSIVNPQVALYRGACIFDNLAELLCASADPGETMVELDASGLTPGVTYFLRINDYSSTATPNSGSFKLCVDEQDPVDLITDGGSTSCTGILFDSGGPDGDYENNENNTFTICPDQPNQCINFSLEYYNMEYDEFFATDQLIFYDADSADPTAVITTLGGNDFAATSANSGVCYEVQASSGCMTIQFISDGNVTFEGFAGSWECSTTACETNAPISVTAGATALEIEQALSTPFTQTTVTDINCDDIAYGTFTAGDDTDLGLGTGLLLTSGIAVDAIGPNNSPGGFAGDLGLPGDIDLDSISILNGTGELSQDACVIELDVFVNTNELSFEYVFGSEEYPEFVNEIFNDIFAFLVSGPGIEGEPGTGDQENIAVIPGTNTLVEINSINNQLNWEYYRNNEDGLSVQYDGLTSDFLGTKKSLTARANVEPCNTYHLKLAIADRGDGVFDSGVFVSELAGGSPQITAEFNNGIDYLVEDCTEEQDNIIFTLNNPEDVDVTYNVIITGSATPGLDYLLTVPTQLTFTPGDNEVVFPITVLSDLDNTEGTENIIITLTNDFGCGVVELATLEILIEDELVVDINAGADTVRVCAGGSAVLSVEGATTYFWTPVSVFDDPSSAMPTVMPEMSQWVFVEGQVGGFCMDIDSVFLEVLDPMLEIDDDVIPTCQDQPVLLEAANNTGGQNITWSPDTALDDPNAASTMANPQVTTQYVATLDLGFGCVVTDTVVIQVDFFNLPELTNDTTICENFGVTLATLNDPNTSVTTYSWTPEDGLDDPSSPTPIAFPEVTTTYELTATTANEACSETSTVTVTVLPADVRILNEPDSLLLCLGESVTLNAETSLGNNENFFWSPDNGTLSSTTDLSVVATPITNTTYFTNYTVGACNVIDSVFIQVDSLPEDMSIVAEPFEDPYCQGELVTFVSPTYEPALYPDITHMWEGPGQETEDTLYNMVITTVDTFTYIRTTVNGGCTQVDEISINVVNNQLSIMPMDTTICPGSSVQLTATADPPGELTWSPAETLSCDDCLDPIATPTQTTTYTLMSDVDECVAELSVTITVEDPFDPIGDRLRCVGDPPVGLNPDFDPDATYTWTSNPAGLDTTDPNPIVNPTVTTTYTGTATNDCGTFTEEITFTVIDPGSLLSVNNGITDIEVCRGEDFSVTAMVDNSSNAVETLTWIYAGESQVGTDATFEATESGTATFIYQYGTTAANDCEQFTGQVNIQVIDAPVLEVIDTIDLCFGVDSTFTLFDGTVQPGVSYVWTGSNGEMFMEADPEVTPTESVIYTLEATLGECTTTAEVVINVIPNTTLTIDRTLSDNLFTEGSSVLTFVIEPPNDTDTTIMWTFLNDSIGMGPMIEWMPDMTEQDSLPNFVFATLSTGCQDLVDSLFIQKLQYRVPNIFSPNGDGMNDVFKPFFLGEMDVVEVIVYNRWGNVVFESDDPNNPGWDGQKDGKDAPSDSYIYIVRVGLNGEMVEEKGEIMLVR